ncbi:hypothetical protein JXR93_09335 [bacterium]|nr:hypothetical protein [bacterium]
MIPISLTIKGLYSYKTEQTVDFTKLTSAHLFGIFGSVGSGKSTILEAILLSIYEKSERVSSNDKIYANIMNLDSDELIVDFSCYIGKNSGDLYRFYYRVKRHPKNPEKFEKDRKVYKHDGVDWLPATETDGEKLLLMDYDTFRKTVIIPQGKFQEFLNQTATNRASMLEKLFDLSRFDLSSKLSKLKNRNELELSKLEGKLSELLDASDEIIDAKNIELNELLLSSERLKSTLNKKRDEMKQIGSLWDRKKIYQTLINKKESILSKESKIIEYQNEINLFEKALPFEKIDIHLSLRKRDLVQKKENINKLTEQKESLILKLDSLNSNISQIEIDYQKLKDNSIPENSLKEWIKRKEIDESLEQLKAEIEPTLTKKSNSEVELKNSLEKIGKIESEIAEIARKIVDSSSLDNLKRLYQKERELFLKIKNSKNIVTQSQQKLDSLNESKINNIKKFSFSKWEDLSLNSIKNEIEFLIESINKKISETLSQIHTLSIQERLAEYSSELLDGEKCPLCGSTEHPAPLSSNYDKNLLKKLKLEQKSLENELKNLTLFLNETNILQNSENLLSKQLDEQLEELDLLEREYKNSNFPPNIESRIKEQDELQDDLKRVKLSLEKEQSKNIVLKEEILKLSMKIDEYHYKISHLENELSKLTQIPDEYKKESIFSLKKISETFKKSLLDKENYLNMKKSERLDDEKKYNSISEQILSLSTDIESIKKEIDSLESETLKKLQESGFLSFDDVSKILKNSSKIEAFKGEIVKFTTEKNSILSEIDSFDDVNSFINIEEISISTINSEIIQLEKDFLSTQKQHTLIEAEIKRLKTIMDKRREVELEQSGLKKRESGLKQLEQMFRGKGFVRYVSEIFLNHLLQVANERFFKLTKNQLRLELDDKQEFIIRDYMNNGKTRLLKTVSGGQMFQAAFSLALALADHVKSISQSEQSFFFIDEGFGSLDKEALKIVTETLKSLRYENKIVGMISHLDTLQHEVEVYLSVKNDKQKGSIIKESWSI